MSAHAPPSGGERRSCGWGCGCGKSRYQRADRNQTSRNRRLNPSSGGLNNSGSAANPTHKAPTAIPDKSVRVIRLPFLRHFVSRPPLITRPHGRPAKPGTTAKKCEREWAGACSLHGKRIQTCGRGAATAPGWAGAGERGDRGTAGAGRRGRLDHCAGGADEATRNSAWPSSPPPPPRPTPPSKASSGRIGNVAPQFTSPATGTPCSAAL